jgi:tetratricopeptide (TPR) repeat protein
MSWPICRGVRALLVLVVIAAIGASGQAPKPVSSDSASQGTAKPAKRVTQTDSIIVGAHLTPEEKEDGKINEAYQPLHHFQKPGDCAAITELCETKVIPMAKASKFELTRNKFLFLANREVAVCEMQAGKYQEAEQRFDRLFEYIPFWPGENDSAFPMNYMAIGTARIHQGRWNEAEAALQKSVKLFTEQIQRAQKDSDLDSEFTKDEPIRNLKRSDATARYLLAEALLLSGRHSQAMDMLERAYQEELESGIEKRTFENIIQAGQVTAAILRDDVAIARWAGRGGSAESTLP